MSDASLESVAPETLYRFAPDIEVTRSGDGRTVCGILAPYDTPTTVNDGAGPYAEALARTAFDSAIASDPKRVKFLAHHNRGANPLGVATLLRSDAKGLYGELYVSKTQAGDEALQLIRDGVLDAFSVGFIPRMHTDVKGVTYRTAVHLKETSIVTFSAYADAVVSAVRSEDFPADLAAHVAQAVDLESPSPADAKARADAGTDEEETPAFAGMSPNQRARVLALIPKES